MYLLHSWSNLLLFTHRYMSQSFRRGAVGHNTSWVKVHVSMQRKKRHHNCRNISTLILQSHAPSRGSFIECKLLAFLLWIVLSYIPFIRGNGRVCNVVCCSRFTTNRSRIAPNSRSIWRGLFVRAIKLLYIRKNRPWVIEGVSNTGQRWWKKQRSKNERKGANTITAGEGRVPNSYQLFVPNSIYQRRGHCGWQGMRWQCRRRRWGVCDWGRKVRGGKLTGRRQRVRGGIFPSVLIAIQEGLQLLVDVQRTPWA